MADTIRELILQNIQTTLEAITLANGFNQDLKMVDRDRLSPLDIDLFPAALILDLGETVERVAAQVDIVDFSVMTELWISQEKGGAAAINKLIGDVKKKMLEDPRRATLAIDTRWQGSESVYALTEQPLRGEQLRFLINYRSAVGDPFTLLV